MCVLALIMVKVMYIICWEWMDLAFIRLFISTSCHSLQDQNLTRPRSTIKKYRFTSVSVTIRVTRANDCGSHLAHPINIFVIELRFEMSCLLQHTWPHVSNRQPSSPFWNCIPLDISAQSRLPSEPISDYPHWTTGTMVLWFRLAS